MKERGFVYILTNPSFREDWVKIGKSFSDRSTYAQKNLIILLCRCHLRYSQRYKQ